MQFNSATSRNATTIGNYLMQRIISEKTDGREKALLTREWLNVEFAKREWRGLPRLSAHSMKELAEAKRASMKNVTARAADYEEITDADAEKESLSPDPVPTRPAPEPPSRPTGG